MKAHRLLGLLGGRGAAGADRPDRLVGDHDLGQRAALDLGQVGLQLALQHRLGLVRRRARPRSRRRRGSARGRRRAPPGPCAPAPRRSRRSSWRRSEWPRTTASTSSSTSIGAETSPVKAPESSSCMFCAATLTALPQRRSTTARQRGERRADDDVAAASPRSAAAARRRTRAASATVLCIFQLAAMYGRALRHRLQRLHSRAASFPPAAPSDAPPPVESQSTFVGKPELLQRGDRVAAADHGRARRRGDRLGDGAGAGRERLQLEGAHRPVPEHGAGGGDRLGVGGGACAGRCRGPSSRRAPRRRRSRGARSSASKLVAEHEVDRAASSSQSEPSACSSASRRQLDALLLDQRVAGGDALGAEEAEAHRAADQDLVGDLEEAVDHADLVGHLGAAEDDDQRPLRATRRTAVSSRHLALQQQARVAGQVVRRPPRCWRGRGGRRRRRR